MENDWKKKYEEALERARKYHGGDEGTLVCIEDMLEDVFPELAESEDEKMLKRIRLCLDECVHSDIIRDYERDECVAWLEKQKDSPMPEDTFIFQKGVEEGRRLEREDTEKVRRPIIETYQRSWYTEGYYDGKLKKEPRWIIKAQGICTKYEENPKYGQSLEEEQKQEWSEEDEKNLKELLAYGETRLGLRSWIAGLPERLGSRPQSRWKPSKEQMRILNWAANGMVDKSIAAPEMRAVLRELYEQLKKLI